MKEITLEELGNKIDARKKELAFQKNFKWLKESNLSYEDKKIFGEALMDTKDNG